MNFIWYFSISALINALTSTLLGVYLLLTGSSKKLARYLIYLCSVTAIWSWSYFIWQVSDTQWSALFWTRILMLGAIFTSVAYFHLVLVYLNLDRLKYYRTVLGIFYSLSLVWIVAVFTPYFIAGVHSISYFKFWPIAGPLYTPFVILFTIEFLYASVLLLRNFIKKQKVERIQTGLLLLGIFTAFVGGSTNYPLWYGVNIPPWGNGFVSLYVILTVYAIMKYRFMDIKVVFAELFTGLLIIIFGIDAILSRNTTELVFRIFALIIMVLFGILLIRSVRREIKRREQVVQLADTLEASNIRLQELDKQKTEFLSIASHQLRTPLSILNGYIELIKDGAYGKIKKPLGLVLRNMDESNNRLVTLVDEFLNITRIEQGTVKYDFKKQDLRITIDSVFAELQGRAEQKDLHIVWHKPAQPMEVVFDADKLRHVIFNYFDNAIKYTQKGKITVSLKQDQEGVSFRVVDTGIGFNRTDEVNFFQKFYRGENIKGTNVNGTGLGLYVCSKFIEAHHGRVWGKSAGLGKGSEFGFWIPYKQS